MRSKKWATRVGDKIISHGQVGARIGQVGSPKWESYCARSEGIAKKYPSAREKDSPNFQSRRKWKCPQGVYG